MQVVLHERFRRNVLAILKAEGITRTELARRLGVPNPNVFKYLGDGGPCPGLDVVEKYAKALNLDDPSELLMDGVPAAHH